MSILTVRQLTAQIKDAVESGFPYVWVRGEVTNVSRPSSGHIYFSLKTPCSRPSGSKAARKSAKRSIP